MCMSLKVKGIPPIFAGRDPNLGRSGRALGACMGPEREGWEDQAQHYQSFQEPIHICSLISGTVSNIIVVI